MLGLGIVLHYLSNLLAAELNISFWTIYSVISVLMMMFSEYLLHTLELSRITAGSFDFGLWYLCLQLCLTVVNSKKNKNKNQLPNKTITAFIATVLELHISFSYCFCTSHFVINSRGTVGLIDPGVHWNRFVADKMGGAIERDKLHDFSWELHISEIEFELKSNIVPIGKVKKGTFYHSALLFKVC